MAINLRYVSKELQTKLKVRAAGENVTLESLCVRFLWRGLDIGGRDERYIGRDDVGGVAVSVKGRAVGGGRKRAVVPVLPKAKGNKVNVHSLQSVRDELVSGSGHLSASSHQGHKIFIAGDGHWCGTCKVNF